MNQSSTEPQLPASNSQLPVSKSQRPNANSQLQGFSFQSQVTNHDSEISVAARATRLVRVPDLHAFRLAVADLACGGTPFDVRDRIVVVPTRAAAVYLTGSIETHRLGMDDAVALPGFATRAELQVALAQRLSHVPMPLTPAEREVLMGAACRTVRDAAPEPPFRLRPGLIAAVLDFYDTLHRNLKPLDTFERLALGMLEPGAADDRGAERLVRQTQFLVAAFRAFERLREESGGVDEHLLRRRLLADPAARPWRHIVVTIGDRAADEHGLFTADWDLLARIHGLARLDVVVTETTLAGAFHERIHQLLPGIEEVRFNTGGPGPRPILVVPPGGSLTHTTRDREEEVSAFARWVRSEPRALSHTALVVRRPLPYVYLAREVLRSAGVPSQMFDALPLAAEPFAGALDVVIACVASNFARRPSVALLRSPHFRFGLDYFDIAALDRTLSDAGYLGGPDVLEAVVEKRNEDRAARCLLGAVQQLAPLRSVAPCAQHLERLLGFLREHELLPAAADPLRERLLRGRAAVLNVLIGLRDAYARFDAAPTDFEALVPTIRRWIEDRTFTPYTGEGGVHVVDADTARFGEFDSVQLAGLVEGEWPEAPRRNIFYPPALLRELGWPSESQRLDRERATFTDLLRLPSSKLAISTFTLENDSIVAASPLVDAVAAAALETVEYTPPAVRVFEHEALASGPAELAHVGDLTRSAAIRRIKATRAQRRVETGDRPVAAYSVGALERYQDCPFKFFAADVLRLEEPPEDEPTQSPRARGKFLHELLQRFFEAWDARGDGAISVGGVDEARAVFENIAASMLSGLPEAEAALERARLFGSAASMGIVDVVLELEASRPAPVGERWLEYRLDGEFSLGAAGGRRVPLKGVADRIDLLAGNRLRVIDYKSGHPPNPKRALQAAVYALCAVERLEERGRGSWTVDEAAYVAFSGKRTLVSVVRPNASDTNAVLTGVRTRLLDLVGSIERGAFSPRPYDLHICSYCAYPSVCRKDYVGDE
jgi:RecB family exonuclease